MLYSDTDLIYFCLQIMLFSGCHVKVHKEHYEKGEEFIGYCKGMVDQIDYIVVDDIMALML